MVASFAHIAASGLSLGALKGVRRNTGTAIPKISLSNIQEFVEYARRQNLSYTGVKEIDKENKKNLFQLYTYNGTKGKEYFNGSNVCFVDIDTTIGVDKILENYTPLLNAVSECAQIRFIQKSYSGKLHIIVEIPECNTIEQWEQEAEFANKYVLQEIKRIYGIDYIAERAWDNNALRPSQALAVSAYDVICPICLESVGYIPFKYRKNQFELETQRKRRNTTAINTEIQKGLGFACYEVQYTGSPLTINKEFHVGRYSGFELRWRIVNAAYEIFGDDYKDFIRTYFSNYYEILSSKPSFAASKSVKEWLIKFFRIEKTTPTLKKGEYLSKYETLIKQYVSQTPRAGIIAPTGAGKTYLIKKLAREANAIILCPYNSVVSQYEGFENLRFTKKLDNNTAYVGTYDQAMKFDFSERLVIVDESHVLLLDGTYRDKLCYLLDRFINNTAQRLLLVSATPCKEFELLGVSKPLEFQRRRNNVKVYWEEITGDTTIKQTQIINDFKAGKTDFEQLIIFDDFSAKKLYNLYGEAALLSADTRENSDFVNTLSFKRLTKNITFSTKVCFNGVDFKNDGKILAVCRFGPGKTIEPFVTQCVGRFRNDEAEITLLILETKLAKSTPVAEKVTKAKKVEKISKEYGELAKLLQRGIANERFNDEIIAETNKQIEDYTIKHATKESVLNGLKKRGYFVLCRDYNDNIEGKFTDDVKLEVSKDLKRQIAEGVEFNKLQYDARLFFASRWCKQLYNMTRERDGEVMFTANYIKNYVASSNPKTLLPTIIQELKDIHQVSGWSVEDWNRLTKLQGVVLNLHKGDKKAVNIVKGQYRRLETAFKASHTATQFSIIFDKRDEKAVYVKQRRKNSSKPMQLLDKEGKKRNFKTRQDLEKFLINEGYSPKECKFLLKTKRDLNYSLKYIEKSKQKQ